MDAKWQPALALGADVFDLVLAAYEQCRLGQEQLDKVKKAMEDLPEEASDDPVQLLEYLLVYPHHGKVLLAGAKDSLQTAAKFGSAAEVLVDIRNAWVASAASCQSHQDHPGLQNIENSLAAGAAFWENTPAEFFDTFLYDEDIGEEIAKAHSSIVRFYCHFVITLNIPCLTKLLEIGSADEKTNVALKKGIGLASQLRDVIHIAQDHFLTNVMDESDGIDALIQWLDLRHPSS